ncbi:hypothetical protein DCC39_05320 [Pueribacillus theae]|uniref:SLH domain-containing protein n=1 Tax=Pueribacillus theae TaxID=2171751 RepID=A0A2U1K5I4_9BACI|nr:S-layer homology domain-containing protein [Pueribacillus theae]PWA12642.1 hypothetical protein DCC39_05320 [Pueribacillus theae]
MSKKSSYRKYAVTTIAAAAAVSAVAPVASAAETKDFTDVKPDHEHYDAIMAMAERGIVTGLNDGTGRFNPEGPLFRAQAAVMFARALELRTPSNVKEVLSVYTDVNENSEYADEIAAVTAAGIFGQFGKDSKGNKIKGKFNPWKNINREQMASVLVRAYDLEKLDTDENVKINLKNVSPTHQGSVQTLANLGITVATDNFKPLNNVTRGQFSSFLKRTIDKYEAPSEGVAIESVKAINAKTLEVTFDSGIDADKAKLEVVKSTIKQNISKTTWAEDNKSVRLELTTKLTKGEYVVNVTGVSEKPLTGSVQVEDERVDSIEILSDIAVVNRNANPTSATVAYQVKNQYGEDVTKTTNLTTNSPSVTPNPSTGVVTIDLGDDNKYKVGDKVPITLVHADSAKSATKTLTLSAESAVSEVGIKGIYNKDGKKLNEDTKTSDEFYLLVDVKDQYGNAITDAEKASKGLIKSETNPTVIKTAGAGNAVELSSLTIDGKKQLGLKLSGVQKAGESKVTLISTTSGKNDSYNIVVAETTRADVVNLSPPAIAVANEDILVPVSVIDKEGKVITDTKILNNPEKGVKATFNNDPLQFVEGEDSNIYIKIPSNINTTDGTFPLVAQSSTYKVATSIIRVDKKAVPTTIRGLKKPLTLKAQRPATINYTDVVVEDQYGRSMKDADVKAYLATGKGIVVKANDSASNVVTIPASPNNIITDSKGVTVTALNKNGSQTIQLVLAELKADGVTEIAASTADAQVRVTDGTNYEGYEIAPIGKVQAADVQDARNKKFTVNGLLDGGKVALDDNDYTATISGGRKADGVEPPKVSNGEITVNKENLNTDKGGKPIDTEFTLRVTINATGKVLEEKFIVSADDKKVEDFFFTTSETSTDSDDYDAAKAITTAIADGGTYTIATPIVKGDGHSNLNFATVDQYGNKAIQGDVAETVTISPEKTADVSITDNGTKNAKAELKEGVAETKLTVNVKVGNATKELKVTLTAKPMPPVTP